MESLPFMRYFRENNERKNITRNFSDFFLFSQKQTTSSFFWPSKDLLRQGAESYLQAIFQRREKMSKYHALVYNSFQNRNGNQTPLMINEFLKSALENFYERRLI